MADVPLLVKIAPDLADDDVLAVADLALELGSTGSSPPTPRSRRDGLRSDRRRRRGARRRWAVRATAGRPVAGGAAAAGETGSAPDLTLVSVGGISTVEDARARLEAGATLVQALHRLRLRGPAVAAADRARDSDERPPTGRTVDRPRQRRGDREQPVGAYRQLTLVAPGVAEAFRPGTFLAVSVGAARLARRALWIHRVKPTGGYGATLDVVVDPVGPGTRWLAAPAVGSRLEVTGPLGRPFALPKETVRCLLVGEGYAAAPLFPLAERLRERECPVTLVVGGADEAHLLSALEARRSARAVTVVTGDGSVGERGDRGESVDEVLASAQAEVVYAAGPCRTARTRWPAAAEEHGRLEPGRPRAAADLRHRALPGLRRPGHRRGRRRARGPRLLRRPGVPRRPGALGRAEPAHDRWS